MRQEVFEAMTPYYLNRFGNPSSLHQFGLQASEAVEAAREFLANTIGAHNRELIFTGSGTESNNLAIKGATRRMRRLGKGNHVLTSSIEHPSVRETFRELEKEGFQVSYLPVDADGRVNPDNVRKEIRSNTVLISVMHVNNVIGTIQPIAEIGAITRENGILLHTDAVQSYGKIPVHVQELNVDLLTINAHKVGGPKGMAGIYVRKGVRLDSLFSGGGQERGLRSSTLNVPGIIGFAKAAELAFADSVNEYFRLKQLQTRLADKLTETIDGCKINGNLDHGLPNYLNISIDRIEGQALMLELDRLGFATSSGSACSSTHHEPSYVLLAMGKTAEVALESLRITMGMATTNETVDELAQALEMAAQRWRNG
jgi:cysteine desulfurase